MQVQMQLPQATAYITCAHQCYAKLRRQTHFGLHGGPVVLLPNNPAFHQPLKPLQMQPRKQPLSCFFTMCRT